MKINRVELTNIKPFAERTFDFAEGINVLSGPNGSGKSTVFEAIGYALFGVDARDFIGSAERFVRKGFKTGVVRVSFTAVDGLDYVIERAAGATSKWVLAQSTPDGPRSIETKNAAETEAVLTGLLGLSDSRSLGSQFTTIIGPPQARFDGAFGVTGKARTDEFDRILGISAWNDANTKALGIENEAKRRIGSDEQRSASLAERTAKFDDVVAALALTAASRDALTAEIAASDAALAETAATIAILEAAEARAFELRSVAESARAAFALATERAVTARRDLAASVEAVALCRDSEVDFETHNAATRALSGLEKQRKERDELTRRAQLLGNEIVKTETEAAAAIANAAAELERLESDRENESKALESAESELATVGLDRTNATELEAAAMRWVSAFAGLSSPAAAVSAARRALEDVAAIRADAALLRSELADRESVAKRAAHAEASRQRATTAAAALAAVEAQLERFRHDRKSLASGHCPILDETCGNLADIVEVDEFSDGLPAPLARRIADAESALLEALEAKRAAELESAESSKALEQLAVLEAAAERLAKVEAHLVRRSQSASTALSAVEVSLRECGLRSWLEDAPEGLGLDAVKAAVSRLEAVALPPNSISTIDPASQLHWLADDGAIESIVDGLDECEHELAAAWSAIGSAAAECRASVSSERLRLDERHRAISEAIDSARNRLQVASDRARVHRQSRAEAEQRLAGLDSARRQAGEIADALTAFVDLDRRVEAEQSRLAAAREGHARFQQNETLAKRHAELETQHSSAAATLATAEKAMNEAHIEAAAAAASCDPGALVAARDHEKRLTAERSAQQARLAAAVVEVARLTTERDELLLLRDEKRAIDRELVLLRKTQSSIAAMRTGVMTKVPARLASRYRDDVSIRADRIYRRIAGTDEELRWGDDYQIQLVDIAANAKGEPFERIRFDSQLSGGQKMTAVIALRLALLQITRSSVGFFDEPTSNLDAERRSRLAEAFRDLGEGRDGFDTGPGRGGRWYGQLFLISHDAAFTEITDHTTWLEAVTPQPL